MTAAVPLQRRYLAVVCPPPLARAAPAAKGAVRGRPGPALPGN